MKNWWYSLLMFIGYLGIFHLWMHVSRPAIIASGMLWCGIFAVLALRNRAYFVNGSDLNAHLIVALDIFLEALLIPTHDHLGFYYCALAFAVVIGGYRIHIRRKIARS